MANVENRMDSFVAKKWIFKTGSCSYLNMAKAGFICTTKTSVQCYYCDKELDGWEENDDPWVEHKKHASYCPFVRMYENPPDPDKFTTTEALQLEKERLLMKVNRKYEETKKAIERNFQETEYKLAVRAEKGAKRLKS